MTFVPGWYAQRSGTLRWWNGSRWTGMRVKRGVPGTDWITFDEPVLAWLTFGLASLTPLFQLWLISPGGLIASAVLRGGLGGLAGQLLGAGAYVVISTPVAAALVVLLSAFWGVIAIRNVVVRLEPYPASPALMIDSVRPLPGEIEGPSAGWYLVNLHTTRWHTGVRWSQYVGTPQGVHPTFTAATVLRTHVRLSYIPLSIAGAAYLASFVAVVVGVIVDDRTPMYYGMVGMVASVLIGGFGALAFALPRLYRRTLVAPQHPPVQPV